MLIIIIPALISQIISIKIFYQRHWYNVSQYSSSMLAKEIETLLQKIDANTVSSESQKYLNLKYRYVKHSNDADKKKLQQYETNKIQSQHNSQEELKILYDEIAEKTSPYFPYIRLDDQEKIIEIMFYTEYGALSITLPAKAIINPTAYIFVLWLVFLSILLVSISLIFSRNQIKSILELSRAAEKYGKGIKIDDYKPSGAQEIRRAGIAFLKMKDRIERQTAKRTKMLAMISHDLKTPLTRMRLQVEMMDVSEEKEELTYDITSMQHMISSYLDFARGEGGEEFLELELVSWVKNLLSTYYAQHNINVVSEITYSTTEQEDHEDLPQKGEFHQDTEIFVHLKPHSFKRAISNCLENALRYAKNILIYLERSNSTISLFIEDDGPSIDPSEINNVFKPFYRIDKARSLDNSSNTGLGLAIAKEIIIGHNGNISLGQGIKLGGLVVKIELPIIPKL